ncbi:centrosomal protein [Tieghemostelium lacteum]|uniref:Centrosomal protein n=1 Tax=Tieghemostelium lacteum TaxID=361077 RepID=A0A151ZAI8_TIELA|nr:centrosomal protein [Tieghemostelium lacteum]|eukprot:KYQ90955.1 centrosomal protein [Tieghemostelium lacteum]
MLPNNNQLHINDLKSDKTKSNSQQEQPTQHNKKSTTTTTTSSTTTADNNKTAPLPTTPKNLFHYNSYSTPKQTPYQNTPKLNQVILEELITDDEDTTQNDHIQIETVDDSPLTPKKSSHSKTPRKWRLVEANCTCVIHDNENQQQKQQGTGLEFESNLCPKCNSVNNYTTNLQGNQQQQNKYSQSYSGPRTQTVYVDNNGGYIPTFSQTTGTRLNFDNMSQSYSKTPFQSSIRKTNYDVVPTGNLHQEWSMLKVEVDGFSDELKFKPSPYDGGASQFFGVSSQQIPRPQVIPVYSNPTSTIYRNTQYHSSPQHHHQHQHQQHQHQHQLQKAQNNLLNNMGGLESQLKPPITTNIPSSVSGNTPHVDFSSRISEPSHQINNKEKNHFELLQSNRKLEEKLKESQSIIQQKDWEYNDLREKVDQYEEMESRIVDFETLNQLHTQINDIKFLLEKKLENLSDQDIKIHEKQRNINSLSNDIEKIRMDITHQQKANELLNEISSLRRQMNDLEKVNQLRQQNLNKDVFSLQKEIEALKRDKIHLNEDLVYYKNQVTTTSQQVTELNQTIREKDVKILQHHEDIRGKIMIPEEEYQNIQSDFQKIKREMDHVNQQLERQSQEYLDIITQNSQNHELEIKELTEDLANTQSQLDNLISENQDMKERLSKVHFIIKDSPRRLLTTIEMEALTPNRKSQYQQYQQQQIYQQTPLRTPIKTTTTTTSAIKTPNRVNPSYLSDLNIIKPSNPESAEQLQQQVLTPLSKPASKLISSVSSDSSPIVQQQPTSKLDYEQYLEEYDPYDLDDTLKNQEDQVKDENEENVDSFDGLEDEIYKEDYHENEVEEQEEGTVNEDTNQSLFSTPSSYQKNSKESTNSFDEDIDDWLKSPNDNKSKEFNFTSNGTSKSQAVSVHTPESKSTNNSTLSQSVIGLYNKLPKLSSDQLKMNISNQDLFLSDEFIANNGLEKLLHAYVIKFKNENPTIPISSDFSRFHAPGTRIIYRYSKHFINIVIIDSEPTLIIEGQFEKLSNFISRYNLFKDV